MKLTEADKLQAYTLAMHQLVGAMANVQSIIRLAKRGDINLMDPEWLERLDHTANGERTRASMNPVDTYAKRLREEKALVPAVVSEILGSHQREGGTPFPSQCAIIVDCTCGHVLVVPEGGDEYQTMEAAHSNHVRGLTFTSGRHGETYWLAHGQGGPWTQVSLEDWCSVERGANFHPKPGCGPAATGGFSTSSIHGRAMYAETILRLWDEQGTEQ